MQLSLFQIDNYGPWTVTPEPRRETDLQSLQARLYADIADFVGRSDGYVFFDRFDNMFGVTNGMDRTDHVSLQEQVRNSYPVTLSVGIGVDELPFEALGKASRALQQEGSAQDEHRQERLAGTATADPGPVTVAHFDIVGATDKYTDREHPFDTTIAVQRAVLSLSEHLRDEYDSIAHFVGGDNIIAICPPLESTAFTDIREHIAERTGIELQVGFGRGQTAHSAGYRAKEGLEICRESGQRVAYPQTPSDD